MLTVLASLVLLLPTNNPTIPSETQIPRFAKVAEGLYRGGQPDKTGFEFLKSQGIKTIINLRQENDEEPIVKKLGMNYVRIPMSISVVSTIPEPAIKKYFEVLNNPDNYPIFIHCKRGADRTGALVGFYRVVAQGWDGDKAYDEARDIGMRWWFPRIKTQLKNFAASAAASLFTLKPAVAGQTLD